MVAGDACRPGLELGGHVEHAADPNRSPDALQTPRARALAKLLSLSTGGQLLLSKTFHPVDSCSGN